MRQFLKIAVFVFLITAPNSFGQTAFSLETWMKQDYGFKLNLIRGFIEVAKKDNVILRLPPEYYVKELDTLTANSIKNGDEAALKHSLGVSVKTIAVMDCDWDSGKDRLEEARGFLGEAIFDSYKKNYPEKYQKLLNGCK